MDNDKITINLSKITKQEIENTNSKENLSDIDVKGNSTKNKFEKENTLNLGNDDSIYENNNNENNMKIIEEGELEKLYNKHQKQGKKIVNNGKIQKNKEANSNQKVITSDKDNKYKRRNSKQNSPDDKTIKASNDINKANANNSKGTQSSKLKSKIEVKLKLSNDKNDIIDISNQNKLISSGQESKNSFRKHDNHNNDWGKASSGSLIGKAKPLNNEPIDIKQFIHENAKENLIRNNSNLSQTGNHSPNKADNFSYNPNSPNSLKHSNFDSEQEEKILNFMFKNKVDLIINKHDLTLHEMELLSKLKNQNHHYKKTERREVGLNRTKGMQYNKKVSKSKDKAVKSPDKTKIIDKDSNLNPNLNKSNGGNYKLNLIYIILCVIASG